MAKETWIRSSFCADDKEGAAEVRISADGVDVRHSRGGAVLHFTNAEWDAFLTGVNSGEFEEIGSRS